MSLTKKFVGLVRPSKSPLVKSFLEIENNTDFPLTLALNSLKKLDEESSGEEELFQFLIEDSIFASLYATFYEQLLIGIKQNPDLALPLIDRFQSEADERERVIAKQTHEHLGFIANKGLCPGCASCDNHGDVAELMSYVQKGDINFFINLYLGMQTIQYAMESLIYDTFPNNPEIGKSFDQSEVLEFRKFIFAYTEEKTAQL